MQELFKSEVLGLARQFKVNLIEVLNVPFLELVWHVGLSLLGDDLLPLALAQLLDLWILLASELSTLAVRKASVLDSSATWIFLSPVALVSAGCC